MNEPTNTNKAGQQESWEQPSSTKCHPQASRKEDEPRPKHPFTLEEILAAKREQRRRPKKAPKPCKQTPETK
jgi:hypothetical protein